MAKKSMEDDILTGGSLGSGKEKSSKKENKKSAGGIKIAKELQQSLSQQFVLLLL